MKSRFILLQCIVFSGILLAAQGHMDPNATEKTTTSGEEAVEIVVDEQPSATTTVKGAAKTGSVDNACLLEPKVEDPFGRQLSTGTVGTPSDSSAPGSFIHLPPLSSSGQTLNRTDHTTMHGNEAKKDAKKEE